MTVLPSFPHSWLLKPAVALALPTGLVPIAIGAQSIDPLTGEHGPVIGAQMDPSAGVVVPVVQVLEALPRGVGDPGLVCAHSLIQKPHVESLLGSRPRGEIQGFFP